jgi:hypothetical protein
MQSGDNIFKKKLQGFIKSLPGISSLVQERDQLVARQAILRKELSTWKKGHVPPGHYYSPIPDLLYVRNKESYIFRRNSIDLSGIDMNSNEQLNLLKLFSAYYADMPFTEAPNNQFRYYLNNNFFAYSDGICLYSMLRYLSPRRFIEVGAGFSSAAALDTSDLFLHSDLEFLFIEPYPDRLNALLRDGDKKADNIHIMQLEVQDAPLAVFESLEAGDVLFIDSSHVSRIGSDVNYLFFEVFPSLKPGVIIHLHDIFYPFEYPAIWIYDQRAWNEIYLLRAFLQYNSFFDIIYFSNYMEAIYHEIIADKMPLSLKMPDNATTIPGGIWLRKNNKCLSG